MTTYQSFLASLSSIVFALGVAACGSVADGPSTPNESNDRNESATDDDSETRAGDRARSRPDQAMWSAPALDREEKGFSVDWADAGKQTTVPK